MKKPLTIRQFDVAEANWKFHHRQLAEIRRRVFILEQGVSSREEFDDFDSLSWHWLATDTEGKPIGTGRLLPSGQIGRMAVLADHRGQGVGAAILEQAIQKARHLGLPEVLLHAQTSAEQFYVRSGFTSTGPVFTEAGIPHVKMRLQLEQNGSKPVPAEAGENLTIRQYDTSEVSWTDAAGELVKLRTQVFVREQNVPESIEQDGRDTHAWHWLTRDLEGIAVGTGRLLADGTIGRMAVLTSHRGQGIGATILEMAVEKARHLGFEEASLHAQSYAREFYEKAGFLARGDEFMEAGIAHQEMYIQLTREEIHKNRSSEFMSALAGADYPGDGASRKYLLGKTDQQLILRKESEFREVSCDLADQTYRDIRIWAPMLDHALYDTSAFRDSLSSLARRNKYTRIRILLYNSHRMVKNGHAIMELARRLPSSIEMRIVAEDYRQMLHEYLLADDQGIVYRLDYETYEGFANYRDKTEVNRLIREFSRAWEAGFHDPDIRTLKI